MADTEVEAPLAPPLQAVKVIYCGVCTLPPEYCEFGGTVKQCEDWLEENHPDLHEQLYSEDAIAATLSTLTLPAQLRASKDAAKKTQKAAAAAERTAHLRATSKVLIKRVERNKRKFVTAIQGLEAHGLDLKKVAKEMGKKFATGSSVTKIPGGGEEIVVQGDVGAEVEEWLEEVYAGVIPDGNIEFIEEKGKKKG